VARKIKVPALVQVSLPLEAYDALAQLAEFEGSTLSQLGRRAVIGLLVQTGMYQPPNLRQKARQQAAAVVKA
jgi:hypothetical protein